MYKIPLTKDQAMQKARQFCAYQERCHKDVREKLYSLGLYKNSVEEIISELVQDNYLNEERFAIQFAGGKFRIKQWGKIKIKYELKQKNISEYCIKKALSEIDEVDYLKTLKKLLDQKKKLLKTEKNLFVKRKKLQDFMVQKGFEADLIRRTLEDK